jgi:hypothetical protein
MISNQSKSYFRFIDKFKYFIFKKFFKSNLNKFIDLIKFGTIPRPHYALGLLMAAHEAYCLGYKKISVIEFGCWECEGLIDLENYISDVKNIFNIDFDVYGFDLGDGHPEYNRNPRDRLYELSKGDYPFNKKDNLNKLKITEMIWGDVRDTLKDFSKKKNLKDAPVGFISFDLGLYTSTKYAIDFLNEESNFFLPRTVLYFDNKYFVLDNEGDMLALNEFNKISKKQISPIGELAEQLSLSWNKWIFLGKRIYNLSDLNHEKYSVHYDQAINIRINKRFTKTLI